MHGCVHVCGVCVFGSHPLHYAAATFAGATVRSAVAAGDEGEVADGLEEDGVDVWGGGGRR